MTDTTSALIRRYQGELAARQQQGLWRQSGDNTVAESWRNFAGNDYLGLAQDPRLVKRAQQHLERWGVGATASPVVSGFTAAHQSLCDQLCDWLGYPQALLFNSGFAANQALLFTLLGKDDALFQDKLNHASLIEAGLLSPATQRRFRHNDMAHLCQLLAKQIQPSASLIVSEGVFSMDGDVSPTESLAAIANQSGALWALDDAHGIGVLGLEGEGSISRGARPDILVVTFGKALGVAGAAVLASPSIIDYLRQFARHYVYSTAMPPAQAALIEDAIRLARTEHWRRETLSAHAEQLTQGLHDWLETTSACEQHVGNRQPFPQLLATPSPIKPLIIGDLAALQQVNHALMKAHIRVGAIRPPTVPANTARLRISLSAQHQKTDITALIEALKLVLASDKACGVTA
ncbi:MULTISPECIES: 8-amino-7-oxononanoate synthase [unclassified Salinivibrio]|uniref:aminotransferase class I/II-fold pyridoxal phosphate-dependent enzyme n=1 Tax=unclassified Salinivibrio TaxID=2636825 RepID=UPI00128DBA3C|nr:MULTISPECIES: 8-amino-7-oxononanoate synthase [unclassified Salinivibrio]MPS31437.1 8-amino-7-oxononanoate synthase [Salinivibrio sp. VYel7]MPX92833.1 8-amino-7-oxononanoate synthase [Salinivibrio sp. VYel9]MPX95483.1 8-amino-7-oxononanoate synthase [Salinivibrio sp. VYel6]MPX99051.1 8-amino-7-oxononanoate synthase [Salinivibrio sp. VYel4]MPY02242.1 8-amino-7-oxononanoate synthase [Salinivibrio sp. VYel5]